MPGPDGDEHVHGKAARAVRGRRAVLGGFHAAPASMREADAATSPSPSATASATAADLEPPKYEVPVVPAPNYQNLLKRVTYGPTVRLVDDVTRVGAPAWLDRQLAPASIPDTACDSLVAGLTDLGRGITATRQRYAGEFGTWTPMFSLVQGHIARAVWSERQLFEVMVDFWSNHLNITCPSSEVWDNRHDFDRTVIRPHALGRFSDMLVACTLHPAMLAYLGNDRSNAQDPNENLGRELLELHTLGVDGGYTENDMLQSALVLTGLSRDWDTGEFRFRSEWHHVGPLRVMGWSHANSTRAGGVEVARSYLQWLAIQPQTARMIARKLARRFVSDDPSTWLVDHLAGVYLSSGTDTTAVLRALFMSGDFRKTAGLKVRRPFEDLVATVRALGTPAPASGSAAMLHLYWMTGDVGHPPLGWHPPNGYPDVAPAWASPSMSLGRWNAHMSLAAHWWPTSLAAPPAVVKPVPLPATLGELVDVLGRRVLFEPVPPHVRTAVCTFLDGTPTTVLRADSAAVGWRLPYAVALLLDSPTHAIR